MDVPTDGVAHTTVDHHHHSSNDVDDQSIAAIDKFVRIQNAPSTIGGGDSYIKFIKTQYANREGSNARESAIDEREGANNKDEDVETESMVEMWKRDLAINVPPQPPLQEVTMLMMSGGEKFSCPPLQSSVAKSSIANSGGSSSSSSNNNNTADGKREEYLVDEEGVVTIPLELHKSYHSSIVHSEELSNRALIDNFTEDEEAAGVITMSYIPTGMPASVEKMQQQLSQQQDSNSKRRAVTAAVAAALAARAQQPDDNDDSETDCELPAELRPFLVQSINNSNSSAGDDELLQFQSSAIVSSSSSSSSSQIEAAEAAVALTLSSLPKLNDAEAASALISQRTIFPSSTYEIISRSASNSEKDDSENDEDDDGENDDHNNMMTRNMQQPQPHDGLRSAAEIEEMVKVLHELNKARPGGIQICPEELIRDMTQKSDGKEIGSTKRERGAGAGDGGDRDTNSITRSYTETYPFSEGEESD